MDESERGWSTLIPAPVQRATETFVGPRGIRKVLILGRMAVDRLGVMAELVESYGQTATFDLRGTRFICTSDPEAIRHVLRDNASNYHKGIGVVHAKGVLGDGLLTSEGDVWLRQRRAASHLFGRDRLASLIEPIAEASEGMVTSWRAQPTVNVQLEIARLTLEVLSQHVLGRLITVDRRLIDAFTAVQDHAMVTMLTGGKIPEWFPLPATRRYKRAEAVFDSLIQDWPEQRPDSLLTLLLAGHETTTTAIAWTWYELSRNADVVAKVRDESKTVLPRHRSVGPIDVDRLVYTKCVVQESMRLHPPVWLIPRRALEVDTVSGVRVAPGTEILICPYTLHRSPRWWQDPLRFEPDRFLPGREQARPSFTYLPFGAGPRSCVGARLAMLECVLVTAMAAPWLRFSDHDRHSVRPAPMLTLRMKKQLYLRTSHWQDDGGLRSERA